MTGFGEARRQNESVTVAVEVRSTNGRYFKLVLRGGETHVAIEPRIEQLVRKSVKRGTVQVQLQVQLAAGADDYRVNFDVLKGYRRQLDGLCNQWHLPDPVSLATLLTLPGVVEDKTAGDVDLSEDWPLVEAAFEEAIAGLSKMRAEEGAALAADLTANCRTIAQELDQVEARMPQVVDEYRERLADRVRRTLDKYDVALAAGDVIREVSLFMERSDVSEEIVRLRSHLEQFEATMQLAESSGRKLDFLTQEMFREANTIGSKSNDVEIPRHVIEIKAAIERMREQVQNVE